MRSGARGVWHVVHRGDTLWSIARSYRIGYQELAEINNIQEPSSIRLGQRLFVPIARRTRHTSRVEGGRVGRERLQFVRDRFIWPVSGPLTSPFGIRDGRKHDGLDIAVPLGTPIKASDDGRVVYSKRLRGYGNLILIKHSGDYFTAYAHNSINLVRVGSRVRQGEVIARVGHSGRARGSHLHFEIRQGKKARNPLFLLPESQLLKEKPKLRKRVGKKKVKKRRH